MTVRDIRPAEDVQGLLEDVRRTARADSVEPLGARVAHD